MKFNRFPNPENINANEQKKPWPPRPEDIDIRKYAPDTPVQMSAMHSIESKLESGEKINSQDKIQMSKFFGQVRDSYVEQLIDCRDKDFQDFIEQVSENSSGFTYKMPSGETFNVSKANEIGHGGYGVVYE